jgi:hypothetical protein
MIEGYSETAIRSGIEALQKAVHYDDMARLLAVALERLAQGQVKQ